MTRNGHTAVFVLALGLSIGAASRTVAEEQEPEGEHRFTVAELERHGVGLTVAAAGVVDVGIELPADVRADADRVAHLAPRFPGIVRDVRKRVGDPVRAGEVLARIESENLAEFALTAAFDGTVLAKHITPGEAVAPSSPAFIVADLSTVWVEIHVHQQALAEIRLGQPVRIATRDETLVGEGVISYVTPVLDPTSRTATARVVLANSDGAWRPGLFVIATVNRGVAVAVMVPRRALHRHDGATVLFVAAGDWFVSRPVTVGVIGRHMVEITSGLAVGERVADENSFLVKAELEKGSAEHDH